MLRRPVTDARQYIDGTTQQRAIRVGAELRFQPLRVEAESNSRPDVALTTHMQTPKEGE